MQANNPQNPSLTANTDKTPSPPAPVDFADRLRSARRARGLTLRDVAVEAGVSIAYLSDLERGKLDNPTLDKLRGIAKALGLSIDNLLGDEPQHPGGLERRSTFLDDVASNSRFAAAVKDQAAMLRRDPSALSDEWLDLLGRIEIAGRRPATESDLLFIFEAIRRTLPGS